MINLKYVFGAACLSLSMAAFVPSTFAQAAGAGASGAPAASAATGSEAQSATRGPGPTGNDGSAATSPSTLGGSVSGSSSAPAAGHRTAGDRAVHPGHKMAESTASAHSSSPMSRSRYENSRHVDMSANRTVRSRAERSRRNRRNREQQQYGSNYGSNSSYANGASAE